MENPGDEKPDDIEIASIGCLYVGPWEKKYWSCSRGKDRYPYPVGYRAIRTHAGSVCQMEICEDLKGPLFVIKTVGGSCFSGQTPDIAWIKFQRSCPKVKSWNGKRLSNKIDGAEFFGLKNPSVQRLLRELVNSAGLTQGGSSLSHFFCSGSRNLDQTHCQIYNQNPSLISAVENGDISGKKGWKKRSPSRVVLRKARLKKVCNQDLPSDSKSHIIQQLSNPGSLSTDINVVQFAREPLACSHNTDSANEDDDHRTSQNCIAFPAIQVQPSVSQYQEEVRTISFDNCRVDEETGLMMQVAGEVNFHSVLDSKKIPLGLNCTVDKHIISFSKNSVGTESYMVTTGLDVNNIATKIALDRCPDAEIEPGNPPSSVSKEDRCEIMDFIPDTCDTVIGEVEISSLAHLNEIGIKNDLDAAIHLSRRLKSHSEVVSKSESKGSNIRTNTGVSEPSHLALQDPLNSGCIPEDAIFQGVAKDSLPEVGSSGSRGQSVEEVDLNLAGQELAKSMMAFLLPQAVPLLKKTYSRRRSRTRLLKTIDPCCAMTGGNTPDLNAVEHQNNFIHQGKLVTEPLAQLPEMNIQESIFASKASSHVSTREPLFGNRSSKDPIAVIPDSFEREQSCSVFNDYDFVQDDLKGNSDTPSIPITVVEEVDKLLKCYYQNDACNQKVTSPDRQDDLCNSMHIIPLEGNNEESIMSIAKHSNHLTENLGSLDAGFLTQNNFAHFNHESKHDGKEVSFQVTPCKCLNNDCVLETLDTRSNVYSGSYSTVEAVNFGVDRNMQGKHIIKEKHSLTCVPKCELITEEVRNDTIDPQKPNCMLSVQYSAPLSETLLCRNLKCFNAPNTNLFRKSTLATNNYQSSHGNENADSRMLSVHKTEIKVPNDNLRNVSKLELEDKGTIPASEAFQNQDHDKLITGITKVANQAETSSICFSKDSMNVTSEFSVPGMCSLKNEGIKATTELNRESTNSQLQPLYKNSFMKAVSYSHENSVMVNNVSHESHYRRGILNGSSAKVRNWNDGDRLMELVGCYLHPEPILSVRICTNRNQLQLIVLCGFLEEPNRNLFIYDVSLQNQKGCPTFIGYTPLLLPDARSLRNINIPYEQSALQLTPDGRSLIFVSNIKAPRCREQRISCLCSNCKLQISKGTAVEIVHVNFGYVSNITKLATVGDVSCISVCEPTFLVAVEENGVLHVWVMNLMWSDNLDEFMLPTFDLISPKILELKGIPNCNSFIIGHNGLGDFALWDLSKRVFLAKFSSPGYTIYQIIPVSVFNWQMNAKVFTCSQSSRPIMESMQKINCSFSFGTSLDDIAIWILISTAKFETEFEVKRLGKGSAGLWRLALMINNTVIMGNILDKRATAVDASTDSGIIGTSDGLFYKWELSSGRKLGNLNSIQCCISCVAHEGKTGLLVVAGIDGRLRVFIEP